MDIKHSFFERFSNKATAFTGSSIGLICALMIVLIWGITGPLFHFSDDWQLVINTGTNVITFVMVFLIQRSQNKDSKAMQLKLNELIAANDKASNRMVDIEDLTEGELDELRDFYKRLAILAGQEDDIHRSHSIDAAKEIHLAKKQYSRALNENRMKMGSNEV
ncbi:MAG: low affinity iron permease family protein [Sphingobacteriaceae bacterium]|jgi:low affinity Fe/Cu permease|nr:MAG: low affinity iron permease family protein [Pedobacter sp.]